MRRVVPPFCFLFFLFVVTVKVAPPSLAAGEFQSNYLITHEVDETGLVKASYQVRLVNQTERFYATQYTLGLGTDDISQVQAADSLGPLKLNLSKKDDQTEINIEFNEKVVGRGQTLDWELNFLNHDYARKIGRIWEIDIPALAGEEEIEDVEVKLVVPSSFGEPAYIFPQPQLVQTEGQLTSFTFNKEKYLNHGLSLAFGKNQIFSFQLEYHLKNPNLYPIRTQIALPPDSPYQTVILSELDPAPLNIEAENDNWMASYQLAAGEAIDVIAKGYFKIYAKPKTKLVPILSPEQRELYLSPNRYWEVDHPRIQKLGQQYQTPEEIYDYVVSTLSYDEKRLEGDLTRLGALAILDQPDAAVCMEFTDLFIAISRAAGIPAREVNGFAYTNDLRRRPLSLARISGDVLHAWPEYYDELRGWVPVDPTWGSTTRGRDFFHALDFNHVAFVYHGGDSEWPPPAGAYKYDASHQNDVRLEFSADSFVASKEPVVRFKFPERVISGLPVKGKIIIENQGNVVYPQADLSLESDYFAPETQTQLEVPSIPPGGHFELPMTLLSQRVTQSRSESMGVRYDGQIFSHQLIVQPFFLVNLPVLLIGGGGLAAIGGFLIIRRARRLFVQK